MQSPILSIVVPTKNRYDTLVPLIHGILQWDSTNFELLIHDNSDVPDLFSSLGDYSKDSRLTYIHTYDSLSMSDNCSRGIENAKGEYICFLGDDDGVVESVLQLCEWMASHSVDTANFRKASYVWPSLQSVLTDKKSSSGNLTIYDISNKLTLIDRPQHVLEQFLSKGLSINYAGPVPYHGITKRTIFNKTKDLTGTCFPAPTPDISGLVSAGLNSRKHAFVPMPLVFSGHSLKSAGGLGRRGMHVGEIADIKSLPKNSSETWSKELPHFWSTITVNAESALKTLSALKAERQLDIININRILASCWLYTPTFRARIIKHIRSLSKQKQYGITMGRVGLALCQLISERAVNSLKRRFVSGNIKSAVFTENCDDINQAASLINKAIMSSINNAPLEFIATEAKV